MLARKLKELCHAEGLLQREIAAELNVDITYVSKMENGEKPVNRRYLKKLSSILDIKEEDFYTLWLADKIYQLVKGERLATRALMLIESELQR